MDEKYGIQVNFSNKHNTDYSAYRYIMYPKTEKAIAAKKRKEKNPERGSAKKKTRQEKRLSVYDVTQLIQAKKA